MSGKLVGLDELLVKLRDRGPQPTHDIAYEFGLNPLDARMLLLHAHVSGLVRRNDWGEWAITDRGRAAIGEPELPTRRFSRPRWQAGAVLASCAAASALIVGAAGGFAGSGPTPATVASYAHDHSPRRGHRHARVHAKRRVYTEAFVERTERPRPLAASGLRLHARPRYLLPRAPVLTAARALNPPAPGSSVRVASVRRATSVASRHRRGAVGASRVKRGP